jgi:hypothetical protein
VSSPQVLSFVRWPSTSTKPLLKRRNAIDVLSGVSGFFSSANSPQVLTKSFDDRISITEMNIGSAKSEPLLERKFID